MKLVFSRHIFENSLSVKYHENSCSGSRVVPCGPADRRTHMLKLIVAYRSFVNVPNTCVLDNIAFINDFEHQGSHPVTIFNVTTT